MQHEETIKDIRKRCRMAMNGIASSSMRKQGLNYKLNFGVDIQKIKDLAQKYTPNDILAQNLWKEDTRELKILATLLYPTDLFSRETANKWVSEIQNQEIREQVCVNLFQKLEFAMDIANQWAQSDDTNIRTTGYWLLVRCLMIHQSELYIDINKAKYVWTDILSTDVSLRNAALLYLRNVGKYSEAMANEIVQKVKGYKGSTNLREQEIYNSLVFDFEFFHNKEY